MMYYLFYAGKKQLSLHHRGLSDLQKSEPGITTAYGFNF